MSTDLTVANIIAQQIGGKAFYMLGTRYKVGDEKSLRFDIRGCSKISHIRITLDPSDTYTVEFMKVRKMSCKNVEILHDIYADQLHEIIERKTGLYLSL